MPNRPATVGIIGAGTMGPGLAVQFARHGSSVTLVDHRDANLAAAGEAISAALSFLQREDLLSVAPETVENRISFTLETAAGVSEADLVIETVSEDREIKRTVLEAVDDATAADATIASNTSGIPITELAAFVSDPARFVGCHWWNPPYLLPLVEVVRGEQTANETVERTVDFVEGVNRDPIVVERDVPGFVWNRIQFAVLRECTHLVEEGVASLEDVERAVRDGYALRTAAVGPFETADLSGLDLFGAIADDLYPHLSDADEAGPEFATRIEAGQTGVAVGAGFHEYDESLAAAIRRRDERVAAIRCARECTHSREDTHDTSE